MTDPLGQSQVIPYIKGLSQKGYRFTLLSCEKPLRFQQNKEKIQSILDDAGIKWVPITYHKNPPVLSTIFDYMKMKRAALHLHKREKFDLVHCRSYISSMVGLHLKKNFNVSFLFDMRGFWADERVDGNLWNLNNPLYKAVYKFFKKKEEEFIANADSVVSLTEAGKREMEKWEVSKKSKPIVKVIPCSADFNLFVPLDKKNKIDLKHTLGIKEGQFVLSYLGSIGTWYMLGEMLDFFKIMLEKIPQAVFLFITPDDPENIYSAASAKNIPHSNILVRIAQRSEVPRFAGLSDLSIFFIKPCFSKLSSSPTKLGELLAMGIPVICNEGVGDVKEIIHSTQGGIALKSFTEKAYRDAIEGIFKTQDVDKNSLRARAMEYYSLDRAIEKYKEIYDYILKAQ